ncbi:MAG: PTS galactosamine/N-acetylgalactosamine transporter subunit IIA [Vallitalea sp.]|jgi:PTS system N-acetylgalactosamine-specific IIA component|nr:PTS galactosamine/N-acetylgalactosamine transporter subunit IIA [Vallitalea sp.]
MIGIIVTGHGNFATGVNSAIKLIAGEQNNFLCIDFTAHMSADDIKNDLQDAIESLSHCDNILLLADLQGGTPFKCALELCVNNDRLALIGGINLPLILESCFSREYADNFNDFVNQTELSGKNSLNKFEISYDEDDEEM